MNDLISRSKVISVLEQLEEHSLTGKMDISNVIYLLNNTPTAYDIDKVIRQLNIESVGSRIQVSLGLLRAIEIVKQGSLVDDVCEWKLKDACYTSSIKHYDALPTSIVKTFTICPYCGKKIKVVE